MRLCEIAPYLGRRCRMMVQCPACGGTHVHEGTLDVAPLPGEVQLDGHAYAIGQIRALTSAGSEPGRRERGVPRPVFDLVWQAGLLLMALSAARVLMR
jgi:hypothetical protein